MEKRFKVTLRFHFLLSNVFLCWFRLAETSDGLNQVFNASEVQDALGSDHATVSSVFVPSDPSIRKAMDVSSSKAGMHVFTD